jgi:hypothetical protein
MEIFIMEDLEIMKKWDLEFLSIQIKANMKVDGIMG